jgi:hypothetical protein
LTIPDGVTTRVTAEMMIGAIGTMRTRPRWVGVRVRPVRETTTPKTISEIVTLTRVDSSATATRAIETGTSIRGMGSCGTSTCRADLTERSSTTPGTAQYTLRGSETRMLSTVDAFRVVSARDLRDHRERPAVPRSGDLRHLREEGLIRTERLDSHSDLAVVLTKEGRDVLESNRRDHSHDYRQDGRQDHRQEFYADLKKPREVEHDSQVYCASTSGNGTAKSGSYASFTSIAPRHVEKTRDRRRIVPSIRAAMRVRRRL